MSSRKMSAALAVVAVAAIAPLGGSSAAAAEVLQVTALSPATGWSQAGKTSADVPNVAVTATDTTAAISSVTWGGNCVSTGAPDYALACDQTPVPAGASAVTLVDGASATVAADGVVEYTPAPGWTGYDTVTITSGGRGTQLQVTVNTPTGVSNPDQDVTVPVSTPVWAADPDAYNRFSGSIAMTELTAPAGVAYFTVDGLSGAVTSVSTSGNALAVSGPANETGGFAGGSVALTMWSADGHPAAVTLDVPAVAGTPVEAVYSVQVAPGGQTIVDVLAEAGLNPAELADFEVTGSTPDVTPVRTADWTIRLTLAATTVPQDGSHDASWVKWTATNPDGSTVNGTLYVSPLAEAALTPAEVHAYTWAGAPVTWQIDAGNTGTYSGDGLTATTSDWTATTGQITANGGAAATVAQDGNQLTVTPAPGWTGDLRFQLSWATTVTREDGTTYAWTEWSWATITVLGPVAQDHSVTLAAGGEAAQVDLAADALWGTTSDLRTYVDTQVSDGYTEQTGDDDQVWVDHPTGWATTGTWAPPAPSGQRPATSATRLVISATGQADLAEADPVAEADVDTTGFAGTLSAARTVATLASDTAQTTAAPFTLTTESFIRGVPATLNIEVTDDGVTPVAPEDPAATPVAEESAAKAPALAPEPAVAPEPEAIDETPTVTFATDLPAQGGVATLPWDLVGAPAWVRALAGALVGGGMAATVLGAVRRRARA